MQASIPVSADDFRLVEGQFSAADASALTDVSPASLQHWTNKGYLGQSKVGLGRGARRMYSAREIEVLAIGNELVKCGVPPNTALECADLVVTKSDAAMVRDMSPTVLQARKVGHVGDISDKLTQYLPMLIATVRMNLKSVDEDSVQILTEGKLSINSMFPDARPAIFIPVGMIKITVGRMLHEIELSKPTNRRTTKKGASA